MINYHKQLVNSLSSILPTYYEMIITNTISLKVI